ncbi:MAG: TonB-dependent receptor plug domain-containing protein, partial [Gemmatimonadales bacterium]
LLHRLPTLNRDLYDFVQIAPGVSTRTGVPQAGGISGGGVNLRFNDYLIDGVSERFLSGNSSVAFGGGKSVPIEAVKEYQVLLSPFDVRYGDFAGAMVNTITRSGTNVLSGSAFVYERSDRLSRTGDSTGASPYERHQVGFLVGGPIVRDRLQFLVAPEFQGLTAPARGPYIGEPATAATSVPVNIADAGRFADALRSWGLVPGSSGAVATGNPLVNLFARLDLAIPGWNSRAVASLNYARNANDMFSRDTPDTFSLSSYRKTQEFTSRLSSLRLHTSLRGGGDNELVLSHHPVSGATTPNAREPVVQVIVPGVPDGSEILKAGGAEAAQGKTQHALTVGLTDNLTVPVGRSHELTVGVQAEYLRLEGGGQNNTYGTWTFASLDSLAAGIAQRFERRVDLGVSSATISGIQYGVYVGDRWRAAGPLTITFGLRGDALAIAGHPPYNPAVDSLFGRRTDVTPASRLLLSPRVGFTWNVSGDWRDRLRGGVGVFSGRPPLAWLQSAFLSYGAGSIALKCGILASDAGLPPRFVPDYRAPPATCANGRSAANSEVDLLDRGLRMAQTLRTSLAWDRRLSADAVATIDATVTRNISDFVFANLNLRGPQGTDAHGRVMYGTISSTGVASPALASTFPEVVDLRNSSAGQTLQVSGRVEKRFSHRLGASVSYGWTQARDVEMALRSGVSGNALWSSARTVSGRLDDLSTGVSLYDLPHRVVVALTWTAPWLSRPTDFSLYYVGESGSPVTYVARGIGRRGDLNADGATGNDPIYVPKSSYDTSEIRFSGVSDTPGADNSPAAQAARIAGQQAAFEAFVGGTGCLRRQRGLIMARNTCRAPWTNTSIATVRQALVVTRGRALTAQLDVFNVLNLLSSSWGQYRVADGALLEQVGETPGSAATAQPVFRYDVTRPRWVTQPTESAFQLQLALRYSF